MAVLDPTLIRDFDLFRSVSDNELRAILSDARTRDVAKGQALFQQGADANEFFVIVKGRDTSHPEWLTRVR